MWRERNFFPLICSLSHTASQSIYNDVRFSGQNSTNKPARPPRTHKRNAHINSFEVSIYPWHTEITPINTFCQHFYECSTNKESCLCASISNIYKVCNNHFWLVWLRRTLKREARKNGERSEKARMEQKIVSKNIVFYLTWASMIWFSINVQIIINESIDTLCVLPVSCERNEQAQKNPAPKRERTRKSREWFHHIGPCDTW